MKIRESKLRRIELFLEGLNEHLGADELHEFVEWGVRIGERAERRSHPRKRVG